MEFLNFQKWSPHDSPKSIRGEDKNDAARHHIKELGMTSHLIDDKGKRSNLNKIG